MGLKAVSGKLMTFSVYNIDVWRGVIRRTRLPRNNKGSMMLGGLPWSTSKVWLRCFLVAAPAEERKSNMT